MLRLLPFSSLISSFLSSIGAGFSADQATFPVGSIVYTRTASEGCKFLFPKETWDDRMWAQWELTGQYPVVSVKPKRTKYRNIASYSCLQVSYFTDDPGSTKSAKTIGPFFLMCNMHERLVLLIGPLMDCSYNVKWWGTCKKFYARGIARGKWLQSPEDATCANELFQVTMLWLDDGCLIIDYRDHPHKTFIAWATFDQHSPKSYTRGYFKISQPQPYLHKNRYETRMNASQDQAGVVFSPSWSRLPVWQVCFYAPLLPLTGAKWSTTLHIGYLDFELQWTGVNTREADWLPYYNWPWRWPWP